VTENQSAEGDITSGVRRGYALLFLFLMEVIEELGTDCGLEMLHRAIEKQADIVARELRRSLPEGLTPLDTGLQVYGRFMGDTGADVEIHRRDEASVTVRVRRCPFYEALLEVGVDCGYFLGGLCNNLILPSIQATLNRFDLRLKVETVMVRQSAEEFCLERIYLRDA
jgi:predicted ArsR family transcriptional regulator